MKDDSPAFPSPGDVGAPPSAGLTKREWMATQIVVGLLAYPGAFAGPDGSALGPNGNKDLGYLISIAPTIADALLEALNK